MLTVSLLFIGVIFFLIYCLLKVKYDYVENFPPGPPKLPFWGSYWFVLKEHYDHAHLAFESMAKKYKTDVLGLYLGDTPTIVPMSYDLCKEALTKEEFFGRVDNIIVRRRGLGELRGLFFIDGSFWKDQRRFSLRHLRDFGFGRRSEQVEQFWADELRMIIAQLKNDPAPSNDVNPEKGVALMPEFLFAPLLNSILLMLANKRFDKEQLFKVGITAQRFQRSGDPTGSAIGMTPWLRYIAPDFFGYTTIAETSDYLLQFVKDIIDEHKKTFSPDHLRDFIDSYIDEQYRLKEFDDDFGFTDDQLLLLVLDYIFPAPMAIGHTLGFFFAHIVNHPTVQNKIFEEIQYVVGSSRFPNLDDRKNMPYLEATIRETFRLIPLNPLGLPRRCTEDTYFNGYFIPKDTIILPSIYTAHQDEEKFGKNTNLFLPERFLDSEGNLMKKDYILGFGAGKRLCVGETFAKHVIFLITSTLLQNFFFKAAYGDKIDMKIVPGINLAVDKNYVKAIPR